MICCSTGPVTVYRDKALTHRMLRKLLALPLLPAEHIQPAFTAISSAGVPDAAAVDQQYCKLSYVSATWLESTVWSADLSSMYAPTTTWKERQIWPDIKKQVVRLVGGGSFSS